MRVHVVDPSAYTPPYDHALCSALAPQGVEVDALHQPLRLRHGPATRRLRAQRELLPARLATPARRAASRASSWPSTSPTCSRYRRAAARGRDRALPVAAPPAARRPPAAAGRRRSCLTAHDVLPREPRPGQRRAQRRLYRRFDAVIAHSRHGARRLIDELGVDPANGARDPPRRLRAPRRERRRSDHRKMPRSGPPVVLYFGLIRPYKGLDVLLDAWAAGPRRGRAVDRGDGRGWTPPSCVPGRPPACASTSASSDDSELPACSPRAQLVVLPYREAEASGVLFTALAFGRPLLVSDAAALPELAATGRRPRVPGGTARGAAGGAAWSCSPTPRSGGMAGARSPPPAGRTPGRPSRGRRSTSTRRCWLTASRPPMTLLAIVFWLSRRADRVDPGRLRAWRSPRCAPPARQGAASVHAGQLAGAARAVADRRRPRRAGGDRAKVANALALDYPRELLEVIVACDGCADETAARARGAGADLVLELPRGARSAPRTPPSSRHAGRSWPSPTPTRCGTPDAARELVGAFEDREVGYACGQVRFTSAADGATNQEGVYWRYEMALRELESRLSLDHGRQRRDLRHPPRQLHRRGPDHGPRPVAPLQHRQGGPARRLRPHRRGAARRWCPRSRASSSASAG